MAFYGRFLTVVIIVLIIANCYNALKRCIRYHRTRLEHRQERIAARNGPSLASQGGSNGAGTGSGNDNNNNTDPEIGLQSLQNQEERRLIVLTSIVHKKVIAESDGKEITLPHTKELSRRSLVKDKEAKGDDDEIDTDAEDGRSDDASIDIEKQDKELNRDGDDNNDNDNDNAKKSDITISTSYSSSQSKSKAQESLSMNASFTSKDLDDNVGIHHTPESLYSPRTCPICLDDYEGGDDICWSFNKKCHHAFHLDCMLAWLMNNDDCPLCREDYLNSAPEAND